MYSIEIFYNTSNIQRPGRVAPNIKKEKTAPENEYDIGNATHDACREVQLHE